MNDRTSNERERYLFEVFHETEGTDEERAQAAADAWCDAGAAPSLRRRVAADALEIVRQHRAMDAWVYSCSKSEGP